MLNDRVDHFPISAQRAFRAIAGGRPVAPKDQGGLAHLERTGWTKNGALTFWCDPEPQYAWLPMAFVTGAGDEFAPPLERLRQTRDAMAFRLAIDLYHAQQMAEHSGIPISVIRRNHERRNVGTFGRFIVWAFAATASATASPDARPIAEQLGILPQGETKDEWNARVQTMFGRIQLLVDCGILEFVSHLLEGDDSEAQILHPIAWGRSNSIEDQLGRVAHKAAVVTFERHKFTWYDDNKKTVFRFVAGDKTVRGMQLVDIARLRTARGDGKHPLPGNPRSERILAQIVPPAAP